MLWPRWRAIQAPAKRRSPFRWRRRQCERPGVVKSDRTCSSAGCGIGQMRREQNRRPFPPGPRTTANLIGRSWSLSSNSGAWTASTDHRVRFVSGFAVLGQVLWSVVGPIVPPARRIRLPRLRSGGPVSRRSFTQIHGRSRLTDATRSPGTKGDSRWCQCGPAARRGRRKAVSCTRTVASLPASALGIGLSQHLLCPWRPSGRRPVPVAVSQR